MNALPDFHVIASLAPSIVLALALVIVLAYTVFGATGFGSSIIAVPALAHVLPLTFAVPLLTTLDAVGTTTATWRQWRRAQAVELKRLLPTMLLGIAAGATILVHLPRIPALLALGVFVASYGAYQLLGRATQARMHPAWAWPIGFAGGILSVLFGTGGPLFITYLSARIDDKSALRATSSAVIAVSVATRLVVFALSGLLTRDGVLAIAVVAVPLVLLGYAMGSRLHRALSRRGVMRLIAVLLIGNGVLLIARAVGDLAR